MTAATLASLLSRDQRRSWVTMKPLEWFRGKRAAWIERGLLDREKRKGLLINWHSRLGVWGSICCWCDQASSPRATWSFFGKTCQESAMRNFKSLTIQQGLMLYRADWNLQGVVWLRIGLDLERSEEEHRRFAARIDYPLLSGPYSKPVSLLLICRSRKQAECGVTLPQSL